MGEPGSGRPDVVAVLGAGGYLGHAVATEFASTGGGHTVRLVGRSRVSPSRAHALTGPAERRGSVEHVRADVTVAEEARSAISGADAIIISVLYAPAGSWRDAEDDPESAEVVNVGVVRHVIDAVAQEPGWKPVVILPGTTSLEASGGTDESTYESQKRLAEELLLEASAEGVLEGISLRLPTIYGASRRCDDPRVGRGVVTTVARAALRGERLRIWGDGEARRDLLHIDDAAAAFRHAVDSASALADRHWTLGTGHPVRLAELFDLIAESVAVRLGRPRVEIDRVTPPTQSTRADARSAAADPTRFVSTTGWRPRHTLIEGVVHLVDRLAAETR